MAADSNQGQPALMGDSCYITDSYYTQLCQWMELFDQEWPDAGPQVCHEATWLLNREARLIDTRRLNDWLSLFAAEALYWVPTVFGAFDPRTTVNYAFDDRRRLEDRVYWLNTGLASSQAPPSRTVHLISNVEVFPLTADARLVRSHVSIHEFRGERRRVLAGTNRHVLARQGQEWYIQVKRIDLLDADSGLENLTLVL